MYILYPQENNKLAILIPCSEILIENIVKKDIPSGTPYKIVSDISYIDSEFFDCYLYKDGEAVLSVELAKQHQLSKFRNARAPILAKLDTDYMRALEANDESAIEHIVSKKQQLRDITKINLPDTLDEIKNTWPVILNN